MLRAVLSYKFYNYDNMSQIFLSSRQIFLEIAVGTYFAHIY